MFAMKFCTCAPLPLGLHVFGVPPEMLHSPWSPKKLGVLSSPTGNGGIYSPCAETVSVMGRIPNALSSASGVVSVIATRRSFGLPATGQTETSVAVNGVGQAAVSGATTGGG